MLLPLAVLPGLLLQQPAPPSTETTTLTFQVVDEQGRPVPHAALRWVSCAEVRAQVAARGERAGPGRWPELTERLGQAIEADEHGSGSIEMPSEGVCLTVRSEDRFAFEEATPETAGPLRLQLEADRQLGIQTLDAHGLPRSGVPVQLVWAGGRDFVQWVGTSAGEQGLATIEHVQLYEHPYMTSHDGVVHQEKPQLFLQLGFPQHAPQRVRLAADSLPTVPVALRMPLAGSVSLVVPGSDDCWARMRTAPNTATEPRLAIWSVEEPPWVRVQQGRALFPFVEIGLKLEVELICNGGESGTRWEAPGPKTEDESAIVARLIDLAPLKLLPDRACILENDTPVPIRWASVCATSPANDRFDLCFVPDDGRGTRNRSFDLQFADHRGRSGAYWHRVEGSEDGHCGFHIDADEARIVSTSLGIPLAMRSERPYRIQPVFTTGQEVYPPGSEVIVALRLENLGSIPVVFNAGSWQRGANRHARFRFEIWRDGLLLPDIDRTESFGGISELQVIEPAGAWEDAADASQWANFDEPGTYNMRVTYELHVEGTSCPFLAEPSCPALGASYVDEFTGHLVITVK